MLAITPEPNWMLFTLFAVLLIITAAFRLGDAGAGVATLIVSLEFVGLAIWRESVLGLPVQLPYLAFILVLYCLTALIVSAMIREVGMMRRERSALIREASDADALRRADLQRRELLDRERAARADAEIATARLETLQRITDAALARSGLDDQLPEMLRRIMPVFESGAAIALVPGQPGGSFAVRAAVGLDQVPRASLRVRGGDTERAIQARRPMAILDLSAAELDALTGTPVHASVVAPLHAEGELVGLLYLACEREHAFTPDELGLLRLIAERVAGAIDRAALLESERRARGAAEAAEGRMRLLLEAGETLGAETAVQRRLEQITRLAVPKLADFCAIDLLEADGSLRRVALAALEVDVERANWAVASRYRREPLGTHPVWEVLRDARPLVWEEVDPDRLQRLARNGDHLRQLLERGICSWMGACVARCRSRMRNRGAVSLRRISPRPRSSPAAWRRPSHGHRAIRLPEMATVQQPLALRRDLVRIFGEDRLVAVIRTATPEIAERAARAMAEAGVRLVEITLTVPDAYELIAKLATDDAFAQRGAIVGAGTVLSGAQAEDAVLAGARFLVSPALVPEMLALGRARDVMTMPGTMTPSEMVKAAELGADFIKIFPI